MRFGNRVKKVKVASPEELQDHFDDAVEVMIKSTLHLSYLMKTIIGLNSQQTHQYYTNVGDDTSHYDKWYKEVLERLEVASGTDVVDLAKLIDQVLDDDLVFTADAGEFSSSGKETLQ